MFNLDLALLNGIDIEVNPTIQDVFDTCDYVPTKPVVWRKCKSGNRFFFCLPVKANKKMLFPLSSDKLSALITEGDVVNTSLEVTMTDNGTMFVSSKGGK